MSTTSPAITKALTAIDAAHALDPKKVTINNTEIPYELHYAQRCTHWLTKRSPTASPALTIAIRAQHFRRWEVPRSSYPMTRTGYLTWRTFLKRRQASLVEQLCGEAGVDEQTCARVGHLIRKEKLASDEETQVLEDVACLVFHFEEELGEDDRGGACVGVGDSDGGAAEGDIDESAEWGCGRREGGYYWVETG